MANIDIFDIWASLHRHSVRYITIGGAAVNYYGYDRTTGDVDILIEDSHENRKCLRSALKDMGIGDFEQIESMEFIPGWTDFTVGPGFRLDIMTYVKGIDQKDFAELYKASETTIIREIPVRFIDYKNLILTKEATNRTKDKLDIEELGKIKKWSEDEGQNFK